MDKKKNNNTPILNSLLDTDFYKFLMLQLIHSRYPKVQVTFSLIDRSSSSFKLGAEFDEMELREQLDHARTLRFTKEEISWLTKTSFFKQKNIFSQSFLDWLSTFRLPEYHLERVGENYILEFFDLWMYASMWEIPVLSIISQLRTRAALQKIGLEEKANLYACAKNKIHEKVERLKKNPEIRIADFGTRRRHSFSWQRLCLRTLYEGIKESFIGTSNALLSMQENWEAVGTNGHELPMVLAALARDEEELKKIPYHVLSDWSSYYKEGMLILLPDAFGSKSFFHYAPEYISEWKGIRIDSGCVIKAGEHALQWWRDQGVDPLQRVLIFSDTLNISKIEEIYAYFKGKTQIIFGWGTDLTNDFKGCLLESIENKDTSSLVCKVTKADGKHVVKLSDTPGKATGDKNEIERYKRIFACG